MAYLLIRRLTIIDCLNPFFIGVYSLGSSVKKDGSPGKKVIFESALYGVKPDANGEVPIVYELPCGKCYNCRKRQAFAWSIRIGMERKLYSDDQCCHLCLTYDEDNVPNELVHSDFQDFIHHLRVILDREQGTKIRYFMCGEYGGRLGRPHFHVLLFGYDFFKDGIFAGKSESGFDMYSHPYIDRAWHRGRAVFEDLTDGSAMYVAQYTQKKLIQASNLLEGKKSPYIQMSRRPGIGQEYLLRHASEIEKDGGLYLNGKFICLNRYMIKVLLSNGFIDEADRALMRAKQDDTAEEDALEWFMSHEETMPQYFRKIAFEEMKKKRAQNLSKGDIF